MFNYAYFNRCRTNNEVHISLSDVAIATEYEFNALLDFLEHMEINNIMFDGSLGGGRFQSRYLQIIDALKRNPNIEEYEIRRAGINNAAFESEYADSVDCWLKMLKGSKVFRMPFGSWGPAHVRYYLNDLLKYVYDSEDTFDNIHFPEHGLAAPSALHEEDVENIVNLIRAEKMKTFKLGHVFNEEAVEQVLTILDALAENKTLTQFHLTVAEDFSTEALNAILDKLKRVLENNNTLYDLQINAYSTDPVTPIPETFLELDSYLAQRRQHMSEYYLPFLRVPPELLFHVRGFLSPERKIGTSVPTMEESASATDDLNESSTSHSLR